MEETRVKMMMAIGQIPPLDAEGMLDHLHEFALEVSAMGNRGMFVRHEGARTSIRTTAASVLLPLATSILHALRSADIAAM